MGANREVYLLGQVSIAVDGSDPEAVPADRKAPIVLAYLYVARTETVIRDVLADEVYGRSVASRSNQLSQALNALRILDEGDVRRIPSGRNDMTPNFGGVWIDAAVFQDTANAALKTRDGRDEISTLRRARKLYGGPFAPCGNGRRPLPSRILKERRTLQDLYVKCSFRLAELLAPRNLEQAIDCLAELTQVVPDNADVWVDLMRYHGLNARASDVGLTFDAFLKTDPSPEDRERVADAYESNMALARSSHSQQVKASAHPPTRTVCVALRNDDPAHSELGETIVGACHRLDLVPVPLRRDAPAHGGGIGGHPPAPGTHADVYVCVLPSDQCPMKERCESTIAAEYEAASSLHRPRIVFCTNLPEGTAHARRGAALVRQALSDGTLRVLPPGDAARDAVLESLLPHRPTGGRRMFDLMPVPKPPEAFVAHPYSLMETTSFIGRAADLASLSHWFEDDGSPPVLTVAAIGGGGKSALVWAWLQSLLADAEMRGLDGAVWWSFYHPDGAFENFITRSLAYVSGYSVADIELQTLSDRVSELLSILARGRFLMVLDGAERLLLAYARLEASRMQDEQVDAELLRHELNYRSATDPRAGDFLRRLADTGASRVLITSRLACADLEDRSGKPVRGSGVHLLPPMRPLDALDLWHALGGKGEPARLLRTFDELDHHPLLIRALAGEVANWRMAPGDFDAWWLSHPDFSIAALPAYQVKSHVLTYAMRGLPHSVRGVLSLLAAFRMPAHNDVLFAIAPDAIDGRLSFQDLDRALSELEERGLVGWDRLNNLYDLHPLVRAVAWATLPEGEQRAIFGAIRRHFEGDPLRSTLDWPRVRKVEHLTAPIEVFSALVGEGRHDEAYACYQQHLDLALSDQLGAHRFQIQLLEKLFSDGGTGRPLITDPTERRALNACYAKALYNCGEPSRMLRLGLDGGTPLRRITALAITGQLFEAELAVRSLCNRYLEGEDDLYSALALSHLGWLLGIREQVMAADAFDQADELLRAQGDARDFLYEDYQIAVHRAEYLLTLHRWESCREYAQYGKSCLEWISRQYNEPNPFGYDARAAYLVGRSYAAEGEWELAEHSLSHALSGARALANIETEINARIALADLHRRQGKAADAREHLERVWEFIYRGYFKLAHADALLVRARLEHADGSRDLAVEAAQASYCEAWCDGPPYAYQQCLSAGRELLDRLGGDVPAGLPAFDQSARPEVPRVQIRQAE